MPLLTASESHAIQSFLSSMAPAPDPVSEWNAYPPVPPSLDIPLGKEALAKATKDLMSLEPHNNFYDDRDHSRQNYNYQFNFQQHNQFQFPYHPSLIPPQHPQHHHQHNSYASPHSNHRHPPTIAIAPLHTVGAHSGETPPLSSSSTGTTHSMAHNHVPSPSPSIPPRQQRASPSSHGAKRPHPNDASQSSANKRPRHSPTLPPPTPSSSTSGPSTLYPPQRIPQTHQRTLPNGGTGKPTLLSPSQKKANHIQSEQKRRANIRRGYEKLCETVPALREALRDEDAADPAYDDRGGAGSAKGRGKRGRGRGKDDGEKIDGRAGPRSENVVLGKTIEYITELLGERSALLSRLQSARAALPRGHPALVPRCMRGGDGAGGQLPLWEREWKGGEGRTGSGDEDDDEDDDCQ